MSTAPVVLHKFFYGEENKFAYILLSFHFNFAMFLGFLILTRSKRLGSYKWYLLNQNISDFLLSTVLIMGRIVALTPHYCLLLAGPLRLFPGTTTTIITASIAIFFFLNTIGIIVLSIINRYIHIFHSEHKSILEKWYLVLIINLLFGFTFIISFLFVIRDFFHSQQTMMSFVHNETQGVLAHFYNESTLMCFSSTVTNIEQIAQGMTAIIVLFALILIFMTSAFVYSIKNFQTIHVSKLSKSLYISAIVQSILLITNIFLPTIVLGLFFSLQIPESANIANIMISLLSLHGTVDTLSMLWFIVPYRKFCLSMFCNFKFTSRVSNST